MSTNFAIVLTARLLMHDWKCLKSLLMITSGAGEFTNKSGSQLLR
jgi:hypothetical protein